MKLSYYKDHDYGKIILTNPPYNTLIHPEFEDLTRLKKFISSPELKGIILTGEGRHFCGGADLNKLNEQLKQKSFTLMMNQGKKLLQVISQATVPIIAVIKGSCLGAGLEIALSCHYRFSSPNAMLGFPESEHGLMPGFGGTVFSDDLMKKQSTIDLILSGKIIRGDEAKEIGLVDELSASKIVEQKALDYLKYLTERRNPELIRAVMKSINNGSQLSKEKALKEETMLFYKIASGSYRYSIVQDEENGNE